MLLTDTFRHNLNKAVSIRDIWHSVLFFAGCLFFFDVFNRRVSIDWRWIGNKVLAFKNTLIRRPVVAPQQVAVLDRLRSRKAELQQQLDEQRAGARYEPSPDAPASGSSNLAADAPATKSKPQMPVPAASPENEKEDYTSRLLKAKKKVWDDPSGGKKS